MEKGKLRDNMPFLFVGWDCMKRRRRMLVRIHLSFLLSLSAALPCTAQELPRGQVIEEVACLGNASQTYALYLPSNYIRERRWPILYALDPGARGKLPVERFREAAEKYGYILAGSNNSQNGPVKIVEDAVNALLRDTQTRFAVDAQRMYVAGFSGGARAAVQVGLAMKGKIAGVALFGAGFPLDLRPAMPIPFATYLAAGIEDFNFPELRELDRTLDALQAPHAFETFSGGHEWPPDPTCRRAIEWLELQAMKSGIRAVNSEAVAEIELRMKPLSEADVVLKWRAMEKEVERGQNAADRELSASFEDLIAGRDRQFAAQKLRAGLERLRNTADQRKDEIGRIASIRVLTRFWIMLNEGASLAFERREYGAAVVRLELMAQVRPDNPRIYYHLARAHIQGGRKREAIESLWKAVARGFKDIATLESDQDLEPLRQMPEYRKILEDLKLR
jgi:dienelactone hydrolase